MKKPVKVILFVVSGIAVIVLAFVIFVSTAKIPEYEVDFPDLPVEVTPERVAEGQRIVSVIFMQCPAST